VAVALAALLPWHGTKAGRSLWRPGERTRDSALAGNCQIGPNSNQTLKVEVKVRVNRDRDRQRDKASGYVFARVRGSDDCTRIFDGVVGRPVISRLKPWTKGPGWEGTLGTRVQRARTDAADVVQT
jgi:hypothetical protein